MYHVPFFLIYCPPGGGYFLVGVFIAISGRFPFEVRDASFRSLLGLGTPEDFCEDVLFQRPFFFLYKQMYFHSLYREKSLFVSNYAHQLSICYEVTA